MEQEGLSQEMRDTEIVFPMRRHASEQAGEWMLPPMHHEAGFEQDGNM